MNETKNILVVLLVSVFIGGAVGMLFQYPQTGSVFPGLYAGAISGAVIGLVSRYVFYFVYMKFRKNPLWAFVSITIVMALGTVIFCLVWEVPSLLYGGLVLAVSVIAGLAATFFIYRYSERLNRKLEQKKKELSQEK